MDYRQADLTGMDLRSVDLTGVNVSHSLIEGTQFGVCVGANFVYTKGSPIFAGADISDTTFEKAEPSVLAALVGATWHGVTITRQSGWLTAEGLYWCFVTNAFVQIGCMQKTLLEWQTIGATREALGVALGGRLSEAELDATFEWWTTNEGMIATAVGECCE